ncbi:hypothetical protein GUA46_13915 [Muricauda sp. HICW]|uniref:Uncharacterized protein n=1 Tax=Flagellimonas chongwuensis TaxID=2697365 RepID=A0A850NLK8_9FLAO|nr:hypothetical protein [Allomuricauda chongwuensis]NVN19442.1 hypothetical protein [Allomuricauda chongwuensis]
MNTIKVFAEYFEEQSLCYRKTTIIQFGDSWELIGSAVLKNPGSANPVSPISSSDFENVRSLVGNDIEAKKHWYYFNTDPTIETWLPRIFNGYYLNKEVELNGVIQLFNLYQIKNQNIELARQGMQENNSLHLYVDPSYIIPKFRDKPVYLGWFDECYLNSETLKLSQEIFGFIANGQNTYLKHKFEDNKFYHPEYLGRFGGYKKTMDSLENFYNLFCGS